MEISPNRPPPTIIHIISDRDWTMTRSEYLAVSSGVSEWELGLPSSNDLTPLSHRLISPELASAFSISPEPHPTHSDVHRASHDTLSTLLGKSPQQTTTTTTTTTEEDKNNKDEDDEVVARNQQKRARLVWTPQLHKRFVEVVAHLGIKNAVPKTIMQMMNVEGLTRENVASHLQKYRLYLKRMEGLSDEGPSSSDHLFASTPIPRDSESGQVAMPMPMMMPGHGAYPWMQHQREASGNYKFGSVGSYHHRLAGYNDKL